MWSCSNLPLCTYFLQLTLWHKLYFSETVYLLYQSAFRQLQNLSGLPSLMFISHPHSVHLNSLQLCSVCLHYRKEAGGAASIRKCHSCAKKTKQNRWANQATALNAPLWKWNISPALPLFWSYCMINFDVMVGKQHLLTVWDNKKLQTIIRLTTLGVPWNVPCFLPLSLIVFYFEVLSDSSKLTSSFTHHPSGKLLLSTQTSDFSCTEHKPLFIVIYACCTIKY